MLTIFILYLVKVTCLEALLPVFAGGMWTWDWRLHYHLSLMYLHLEPINPIWFMSRTPLYNLLQAFFLNFSGPSFANFQIINALLGSLFILSLYPLACHLFDRRLAKLSLIFIFFNPWFLHNSWFTWPKMLATAFILLGFYFYLKQKLTLSGLIFGLAHLTHPLSLLFFIAVWLTRPKLKLLLPFLITIAPWYLFLISRWNFHEIIFASPAISHNLQTSILHPGFTFIKSKTSNAIFSIIPFYLPRLFTLNPANIITNLANIYDNPLFGTLTFTGSFLTIYICFKLGLKKVWQALGTPLKTLWPIITIFFILAVLAHSGTDKHGIFHNALTPLAPLAVMFLIKLASVKKAWLKILFIGAFIENFIGIWLHVYAVTSTAIFKFDPNWELKVGERLQFLSDTLPNQTKLLIAILAILIDIAFAAIVFKSSFFAHKRRLMV